MKLVPALRTLPLSSSGSSEGEIQHWLVVEIARELNIEQSRLLPSDELLEIGLNSLRLVELTARLEDWLDKPVEPSMIYDFPTIESLAAALACLPADE